MTQNDALQNLMQELRRGTLVIGVLSQLHEPEYGYSLVQKLNDRGMPIDQGTLYPLLRRLEKQGLLDSSWEVEEPRPRRYYKLSDSGLEALEALKTEWQTLVSTMNLMLSLESEEAQER
ncbi:PadR family transcriptional regulator [Acidaminobacter hydrogenoformans]|uniref:DNA-binding transcriptional regulator, PadR family n=1 Tax=Acidaminobacter hydrogenoformans DSM 2784 TaxID=1120920 RepID=A0A1G5S6F6_9FIRM|nr:PadR family transcriptional regulator [Acidaminobacter hydrogenoformans]SCZ81460.1 DNA-binding transcriptional regulator, PadR family [Acidaminobacter hydrogenoformans DSM 2784]